MLSKYRITQTACVLVAAAVCSYGSAAIVVPHTKSVVRKSCPNFLVIDSRGSGEPAGKLSPPGEVFVKALRNDLPNEGIQAVANPYPAAGGKWDMIGAFIKVAFIGKYHASVVEGRRQLTKLIASEYNACRATLVILAGYSQGAQVAADYWQEVGADNLWGTVIFGDPYFNIVNGVVNKYSSRDPTKHGRLGERPPLFNDWASQLWSFCHQDDPVCQNISIRRTAKVGFTQHKNYQKLGEPEDAARYFADVFTEQYG